MSGRVATKVIYRQCGWMKCVACSDSVKYIGRMWVGYDKLGQDRTIICQACLGAGEVAQYQIIDAATGEEIDYEAFGITRADEPERLRE